MIFRHKTESTKRRFKRFLVATACAISALALGLMMLPTRNSVLGTTLPDTKRMFGPRDQVDPVRHLIGSAIAYGGNTEKDALYLNVTPGKNDGKTVHRLTINGQVPVDGFWSIIVYNDKGYLERNRYNAYSLNSITAKKRVDGSVSVQFGGCDGKIPNCLPIMPAWNYMVRLYRPRNEILEGTWKFPEAKPVGLNGRLATVSNI